MHTDESKREEGKKLYGEVESFPDMRMDLNEGDPHI